MKRRLTAAVVVAAAALLCCPEAGAQRARVDEPKIIDLTFPGGTVAEYVEVIRAVVREVNIVVAPEVTECTVPPMELKSISVSSAVQLVEADVETAQAVIEVRVEEIPPGIDGEKPIFRILSRRRNPFSTSAPEVRVWSMAGLVGAGFKAEDVLTAVETAVELLHDDDPPASIRFHEATSLLIVSGSGLQLEAIDSVIEQLNVESNQLKALWHAGQDSATGLYDWISEMKKMDDAKAASEAQGAAELQALKAILARKDRENEDIRAQHRATLQHRERLVTEIETLRVQLNLKENRIKELEITVSKSSRP